MAGAKHQMTKDQRAALVKRIVDLQAAGLTPSAIAERLGTTTQRLRKFKEEIAELRAAEGVP